MLRLAAVPLALAALVPTTLPITAQDSIGLSPEQLGRIFCISRLASDMAAVEGILTEGLEEAIDDAETKDEAWAVANPGDKPPLGDGIPWQYAPDYAAECTVGEVVIDGYTATVAISYGFPEYPEANFTDVLNLALVDDEGDGLWRLDNVTYADGTDLRSALLAAFAA